MIVVNKPNDYYKKWFGNIVSNSAGTTATIQTVFLNTLYVDITLTKATGSAGFWVLSNTKNIFTVDKTSISLGIMSNSLPYYDYDTYFQYSNSNNIYMFLQSRTGGGGGGSLIDAPFNYNIFINVYI